MPGLSFALALALTGFELEPQEVAAITALGDHGGRLWGGDPEITTL